MEVKKSFYTVGHQPIAIARYEEVVCNLCGAAEYTALGRELEFEIRQCAACSLVYVNPQPTAEELPRFYEGMYADQPEGEGDHRSLGYIESHLRAIIRRRKPEGGRLFEVGCGYGRFLEAMRGPEWSLAGIEISAEALAHARRRAPDAQLAQSTFEDAPDPGELQDCVVLIAVLEHVKNPRATLERLATWLKPGGLLVLVVPYLTPFLKAKRFVPGLPIYLEAPRHLFDFSPKTLERYLRESGFEAVKPDIGRPYSSPSRSGELLTWSIKLPGIALHALSGGRYVYPFASSIVMTATRKP